MTENELAEIVVDTSLKIHRKLGPGLLESVYESILAFELGKRGIVVQRQVPIPLIWEEMLVQDSFRADLILNGKLLIELKSVEKTIPLYKKQVLTYLKVSGLKLGLLINFGSALLRDNIERVINGQL